MLTRLFWRPIYDPKPLYYQFQAELTDQFTWDYLEQGPEAWRVGIGRR
ncbi:MAG: DUF2249 domain-containing protein [Gammaproteobacteria bacterium]|nr:DUF2249 domain-containing protein [Gammaproteobacteria bacterium]